MSFGINAFNADGDLILDTDLPQMSLQLSGSYTLSNISEAIATPTVITHAYVSNPLHLVRPQAIGTYFGFGYFSSTGFQARASGAVDYRIYQVNNSAYDTYLEYGIELRGDAGNILYNSGKNLPFVRNIQEFLNSSDLPTGSTPTPKYVKTLTINVTAYDGGLPFINASALGAYGVGATTGKFTAYGGLGRWLNTTTLEINMFYILHLGTDGGIWPINFFTGQYPRSIIAIR